MMITKKQPDQLYNAPHVYDIAFSQRDFQQEVRTLLNCSQRINGYLPSSIIDICCGTAPHLPYFTRQGMSYVGLDASAEMLEQACLRQRSGVSVHFIQSDMKDFTLHEKVDMAFLSLGSLYVASNQELETHLDSVQKALTPGGLYILDWCVMFDGLTDKHESWDVIHGNRRYNVDYSLRVLDPVRQVMEETIITTTPDKHSYKQTSIRKAVFPQEFILLIKNNPMFDFAGWWNNWDIDDSLDDYFAGSRYSTISRPICAIRRSL